MFEKVCKSLIAGEFICNVSDPSGFSYLSSEEIRSDVSSFFSRLNFTLECTANKDAWFLGSGSAGDRSDIRNYFSRIKLQIRPVVAFLRIVMLATANDQVLEAGDKVRFDQLLNAIGDNPNLQDQLKSIPSVARDLGADQTIKAKLSKLCAYMCSNGYFLEEDSIRQLYRVTGKMSHFHEVIAFLVEHEIAASADEITQVSESLF